MPKLKCQVNQCIHNSDGLCSKNYIDVDGPTSNSKKETSCKSYLYKGSDLSNYEFSKFDETPSLQTEVYCDAIKCVYEKGQRCYADKIEIANVQSNSQNTQTVDSGVTHCKTFEPRD
jgi:hypothetical protein